MLRNKWIVFLAMAGLFIFTQALTATNLYADRASEPAIFTALSNDAAIILDEATASEIRGRAKYVMIRLSGINSKDEFVGSGATWDRNPTKWRYGNWGGPDWSDGKENPKTYDRSGSFVDGMDKLFRQHDNDYADAKWINTLMAAADVRLLNGLSNLPNFSDAFWGSIYASSPSGAPKSVQVYYSSFFSGGKKFKNSKSMPFSEYARLQAKSGISALLGGRVIVFAMFRY